MRTIHKFQLPLLEKATVRMPDGARIIRVDGLDGFLWLWAVVDTERPMTDRSFLLFKTGGVMPEDIDDHAYVGCGAIFIQQELMLYVFERRGDAARV